MKNVFVVLVCLCARLNAFTVPRDRGSEFLEEDVALLPENGLNLKRNENLSIDTAIAENTELLQLLFNLKFPKVTDLETKQEYLDNKALYEHVTKKANNINERAFILIDQRFKVPVLNHLYNAQLSAQKNYGGTRNFKTFLSNINSKSKFLSHFQTPFNTREVTPLLRYIGPNVRESCVTYNNPPNHIVYNTEKKNAITNELTKLKIEVQAATKAIGHQYQDTRKKTDLNEMSFKNIDGLDYLELLKYPLLRSDVNNFDDYVKPSNIEDSDYDSKHFRYNSKVIGPVSSSFAPQRDFHKNSMAWNVEKMNLNEAVRSDDVSQRVSDDRESFEKYDNNKLLERTPDDKRNINTMIMMSDTEETNSRCKAPACTSAVYPQIKPNEKCSCDAKAEEILKSGLGEIVDFTH